MSEHKKAKMAVPRDTLPGTETDGQGNFIPLKDRTQEDQAKVAGVIARAVAPDDTGAKNPEGELQNPAPIPDGQRSGGPKERGDLQGQQGGQRGGSREP